MVFILFVVCAFKNYVANKGYWQKNLPKKTGYVLTCNHYSNLDPIVLDLCLKKKIRFIAKKELFNTKLKSWFMKKIGAFPVDRAKMDVSTFKFALKTLKEEKVLGVFPEGTRNKTGSLDLQEVKSGATVFAGKAEKTIVPAVLYKKTRLFRRNYLLVGEPIVLEAENVKKMTQEEIDNNTLKLTEAMNKLREDFELNRKKKKEQ